MKLSEKKVQELKNKKVSVKELNAKYFYTKKDGVNIENILKLLNESICSFGKIVDKFKRIKDLMNRPCLYKLLENKNLLEKLIESNILNIEDLRYLLNRIDKKSELDNLIKNTALLKHMIESVSFKELIDKFKSIKDGHDPSLYRLLWNKELFIELTQNTRLNKDDLRYLLNRIDEFYELDDLCRNTSLIKEILNEFVLNKELVDKFNRMIENDDWFKDQNIHSLFELIEYLNENNEEILKLNELNKYMSSCDFNEDQKLELAVLIVDNEISKNRLIQIVDSNLESQFDFESLMRHLKKEEKKSLLNI